MSLRVFVPPGVAAPGRELELDEDESRYLLRVRRARAGATIELLDGEGGSWVAELTQADRRARVVVVRAREDEGPGAAARTSAKILLLGMPDTAALLEAVTGAAELGATQIVFVRCERSQGRCPSRARLDRVLRATMRQCGRPSPPSLLGASPQDAWSLSQALDHEAHLPGLFGALGVQPIDAAPELGVRLLVGPEGGLTDAEVDAAIAAGFVGVGLGPWTLRTPTAVVALLARHASLRS